MDSHLEQILSKLLVPDNATIGQATSELKEIFKNPQVVAAFCNVLSTSLNPQVRQYAAILLRRKFKRKQHWRKLNDEFRQGMKKLILDRLIMDDNRLVRIALVELAGSIAKTELSQNSWPELLQFLFNNLQSNEPHNVELGMFTLSILSECISEEIKPHLALLLSMFSAMMVKYNNKIILYYIAKTLTSMAYLIGSDEKKLFQDLMPRIFEIIRLFALEDQEKACEIMVLFDELLDTEVTVIVPFIKPLIELCLALISNNNVPDSVKIKSLNIINYLTRLRHKVVLKNKLWEPILKVVFLAMCVPVDEDEEQEIFMHEGAITDNSVTVASYVLEAMALHLPPAKVVEPLLTIVHEALQSDNPYHKKAAYLAIGNVTEGCSEYLRSKYLFPLLECVSNGIKDPSPIVVRAALYAVGEFSQYLQYDVAKFASVFVETFMNYLSATCQSVQVDGQCPANLCHLLYALQHICENLGDKIVPHLPTIMEQLFTLHGFVRPIYIKDLILTVIGSVAHSAKKNILPYMKPILETIKIYLTENQPEEHLQLQIQAISTLAILARSVGEEHFRAMSTECVFMGLKILSATNDPDLKRSMYRLFASIAFILKEDVAPFLPDIIPCLVESLESTEGVTISYKDSAEPLSFFELEETEEVDLEEDEDDDEDEDEEIYGFNMGNSYAEEKEDACDALKEIALYAPKSFLPYLRTCLNQVVELTDSPTDCIHKAAFEAFAQFCCVLNQSPELDDAAQQELVRLLDILVPLLLDTVQSNSNQRVVMSALETLTELLKNLKGNFVGKNEWLKEIVETSFKVMERQVTCQGNVDDDELDDEDSAEAETDMLLFEHAAEIFPYLALIIPTEEFKECFNKFLYLMMPKLNKKKTEAERSFAVGMLAQCCVNMRDAIRPNIMKLFPAFMNGSRDRDDEVKSNAIFGLGVLMENGHDLLTVQYASVFEHLVSILSKKVSGRVHDNACAALARMIMVHPSGVNIQKVFPVLLDNLPLKEDFEEIETIFKLILFLMDNNYPELFQHLLKIFNVCCHTLLLKQANEGAAALVIEVLNRIQRQYPEDFFRAISALPAETAELLKNTTATSSVALT